MDRMALDSFVERHPKVLIFDWFFRRGPPPAALPVRHPLIDAVHYVFRISVQHDVLLGLERVQRFDRCRQLHTIVGGLGFAAMQRFLPLTGHNQYTPAPRTRVAATGAIGIDLNLFAQSGYVLFVLMVRPVPRRLWASCSKPDEPASGC